MLKCKPIKFLLLPLLIISQVGYSQVNPRPDHDPPETINKYAAAVSFDICTNSITVADATGFGPGDTILIIQMKGALIDTSNSPSFGTILDYRNAGNYEFNFISQRNGNVLTLLNKLLRSYDIPGGVVQLVRVPKYKSAYFSGGLTCDAWDGEKGGIVAVYSSLSLTSVEDIYVSGRGFRGALGFNAAHNASSCAQNNYYYPAASEFAALRGESIGSVSQSRIKGRGRIAAGGGGGNSHNSGGGGGGNGGTGGNGGHQSDSCNSTPLSNGGLGGAALLYNNATNKIFMGSGGGAGHMDNAGNAVPWAGNGGGIIIIITDTLEMFEELILANGFDAAFCGSANCSDGNNGGGAGGTILLSYAAIRGNLILDTRGGNGASKYGPSIPGGKAGPGGGGGAGVTILTGSAFPANISAVSTGGAGGVILQDANDPYGATAGADGVSLFNLALPWATIAHKPNIDSVRIQHVVNYCNNVQFKGSGFTNTFPIASWYWDFDDGGNANTQNAVHNFNAVGNYAVKLVITDINGCKDSIISNINTAGPMTANAGPDSTLCANGFISILLNGSGSGNTFSWAPAALLDNSTLQDPTARINDTTKFYMTVSNGTGCSAVDSVTIMIRPTNLQVRAIKSNDINCNKPFAQLNATGATDYSWSPAYALNNSSIANPIANPAYSTKYYVTAIDNIGCSSTDSVALAVDFHNKDVLLPNGFSPNGDGINDCFGLPYYRDVEGLEFLIYNRYGNIVFKTSNAADCWDGFKNGKPADPGAYTYYLKAKTLCGNVVMQGSLLLLR